jgi:hypothetical protein
VTEEVRYSRSVGDILYLLNRPEGMTEGSMRRRDELEEE